MASEDLTGRKFGKLTVLSKDEPYISKNGTKRKKWLCQCECGKQVSVLDQNLKNGTAKSCGCSRMPDLTGQKFGRLTVIRRKGSDNCNKATWLCECECGNQIIVTTGGLRSGNTKSCGCYRTDRSKEYWQENMIDLTGKRFGKLTVIKRSDVKDKHGQWKWLCKCECGNETLVTSSNLKRKNGVRSCGCTKHKDVLGQRFGKLKVISKGKANGSWICLCDCGNVKEIYGNLLLRGVVKSCGCLFHDTMTKHGHSNDRIYRIWVGMKQRCFNTKSRLYEYYGARGITVCKEWLDDFMNFYNWSMANGYSDNLSIDRIDSSGNYCPENCRWVTQQTQVNNTRRNTYIEFNGEKKTVAQWSKIKGINTETLYGRVRRGVPTEHLFDPVKK